MKSAPIAILAATALYVPFFVASPQSAVNTTHAHESGMLLRQIWAQSPDNSGNPSADGRLLSFVDWATGDVGVRDLLTRETRRLTKKGSWAQSPEYAEWPKVSRDGKRIAYSWVTANYQHELRVVDTDQKTRITPRVVLSNPDLHYIIPWDWSPDDTSVVALLSRGDDTNQLARISIRNGSIQPLKSIDWLTPTNLSISPDGRFIVYDLNQADNISERDLFILSADGSKESRLVNHPSDDYAPVWAPDGNNVLFFSNRTGTAGLWSLPVRDGQPTAPERLIKSDLGQVSPLGITRDGSLFFAEHRGMDNIWAIELDPESGKVRGSQVALMHEFLGRNSAPVWSPDGKSFAYFSNRDPTRAYGVGTREIAVRSVETGRERLYSGTKLSLRSAVHWLPDGQSLLITAKGIDTRQRSTFALLDLATGHLRTIATANITLPFPAVLPDGKSFLVAGGDQSNGAGVITRYDFTGGEPREVYRAPPSWVLRNLAASADGGQLAFSVANQELRRNVIYTLPVAGGQPREIARLEVSIAREGLAWTPDGRFLYFVAATGPDGNQLFRVPAGGGTPEPVGLSGKGLSLLSMHPDGRHLAYTTGQYFEIDVWALEHFLPGLK